MKHTIVIDTSVLIYDPEAFSSFEHARIIIPFTVIEELEVCARHRDEAGKNAARALSNLRHLVANVEGSLSEGTHLDNGSHLYIEQGLFGIEERRLSTLELLKSIAIREPILFVTKSLARRLRAEALGITSRDYENKRFSFRSLYQGFREVGVSNHQIETFYKNGDLAIELTPQASPNEYFFLSGDHHHFAYGRYNPTKGKIEAFTSVETIWGIKPLNVEQKCALDLLLRDDVQLITLMGQAGSGKTILALAAALHQVFDKGKYSKLLISRPIVPMGKDIGFLPGLKEEKLLHWMQPIYDNMEFLFNANSMEGFSEMLHTLIDAKKLEMEALTYIRGRSLPNVFIIIDEAQNLTPHEIKTIISRAGKGTKIVLTGDPTQIDSLYFDENSNGLTYLVGKFHHLPLYGHMFMQRTERSALAAAAAAIL